MHMSDSREIKTMAKPHTKNIRERTNSAIATRGGIGIGNRGGNTTTAEYGWIILSVGEKMAILRGILNLPALYFDDALTLTCTGWENYYVQHRQETKQFLFYDVEELLSAAIEECFVDQAEYDTSSAAFNTISQVQFITDHLYDAMQLLDDTLTTNLSDRLDDQHQIGLVRTVGEDLAIRIDRVCYFDKNRK